MCHGDHCSGNPDPHLGSLRDPSSQCPSPGDVAETVSPRLRILHLPLLQKGPSWGARFRFYPQLVLAQGLSGRKLWEGPHPPMHTVLSFDHEEKIGCVSVCCGPVCRV